MSMSLIQCLGRSRSPSCHRFFLSAEFKYCIVGCAVAVWVALPFMKIFDVVSDAVIYSLFVQDMAKPAPPELIDEVLPLRSKQKKQSFDWFEDQDLRLEQTSIDHTKSGTLRPDWVA